MKPKSKKEEELNALKKDLAEATNLFVAQFQGITVAQDTELRQKISGVNGKYRVVKNTLAKVAAKGTPVESLSKSFEGPTSIAYNNTDPVALAKALTAYAKVNPVFVFKAGMVVFLGAPGLRKAIVAAAGAIVVVDGLAVWLL